MSLVYVPGAIIVLGMGAGVLLVYPVETAVVALARIGSHNNRIRQYAIYQFIDPTLAPLRYHSHSVQRR